MKEPINDVQQNMNRDPIQIWRCSLHRNSIQHLSAGSLGGGLESKDERTWILLHVYLASR